MKQRNHVWIFEHILPQMLRCKILSIPWRAGWIEAGGNGIMQPFKMKKPLKYTGVWILRETCGAEVQEGVCAETGQKKLLLPLHIKTLTAAERLWPFERTAVETHLTKECRAAVISGTRIRNSAKRMQNAPTGSYFFRSEYCNIVIPHSHSVRTPVILCTYYFVKALYKSWRISASLYTAPVRPFHARQSQ